jgi:hypothetical protein
MKRILQTILCLLLLFSLTTGAMSEDKLAWLNVATGVGSSTPSAVAGACSACPSDSDGGDLLCEDFEGTGNLCTLTENNDSNVLDDDYSHGGTYDCDDKGSQALRAYDADFQFNDTYMLKGFTSNANVYARTDFRFVQTDMAASEGVTFFALNGPTNIPVRIYLYNNAGTWILRSNHYNGVDYTNTNGTTAITLGTWYTMTVLWESGSELRISLGEIGGPLNEEIDPATIGTNNVNTVYFGIMGSWTTGLESGEYIEIEYDNVKVDDDTMPGPCNGSNPELVLNNFTQASHIYNSTLTLPFIPESGEDRCVFVFSGWGQSRTLSSIQYDSNDMDLAVTSTVGGMTNTIHSYCTSLGTTSKNIVITLNDQSEIFMQAIQANGVNTASPIDDSDNDTITGVQDTEVEMTVTPSNTDTLIYSGSQLYQDPNPDITTCNATGQTWLSADYETGYWTSRVAYFVQEAASSKAQCHDGSGQYLNMSGVAVAIAPTP